MTLFFNKKSSGEKGEDRSNYGMGLKSREELESKLRKTSSVHFFFLFFFFFQKLAHTLSHSLFIPLHPSFFFNSTTRTSSSSVLLINGESEGYKAAAGLQIPPNRRGTRCAVLEEKSSLLPITSLDHTWRPSQPIQPLGSTPQQYVCVSDRCIHRGE